MVTRRSSRFQRQPDAGSGNDAEEPHRDRQTAVCGIQNNPDLPHAGQSRSYLEDITVRGAWTGPAARDLHPHALAPVAELPVPEVLSGVHIIADLTLGLGKVDHDYLR